MSYEARVWCPPEDDCSGDEGTSLSQFLIFVSSVIIVLINNVKLKKKSYTYSGLYIYIPCPSECNEFFTYNEHCKVSVSCKTQANLKDAKYNACVRINYLMCCIVFKIRIEFLRPRLILAGLFWFQIYVTEYDKLCDFKLKAICCIRYLIAPI